MLSVARLMLKAIVPRFPMFGVDRIDSQVRNAMRSFGTDAVAAMGKYPPARPWKNPPRTGPRAGGRRTGNLGRGWAAEFSVRGNDLVSGAYNAVGYAPFVQGPNQTGVMAARNWQRVDKETKSIWAKRLGEIAKALASP